MRIVDLVPPAGILFRLGASDGRNALCELGEGLARVSGLDVAKVVDLLQYREHVCSTAVGEGVAIPHARLDCAETVGVLGLAPQGIDFGAPDGQAVTIFVAFVSRPKGGRQLEALAAVSRELATPAFRRELLHAGSASAVHDLLAALPVPPHRP